MSNRILPLDGLRAICALGVIWIHLWSFFGAPSLIIWSIDIYKSIAFLGNGVDFFFVISGFCMYLVCVNKKIDKSFLLLFLKKRVLRIYPAFIVSAIVYTFFINTNFSVYESFLNLILNIFMLQNFVPSIEISGPFWSIATEWNFYLIIPFLFINTKIGVVKSVLILIFLSIFLYAIVNYGYLSYSFWEKQILVRFPEFGWGIIAGYYFTQNFKIKGFFSGVKGIIAGFVILYIGRLMMVNEVNQYFGNASYILKTLSLTIMTFGFSLIMFLAITTNTFISKLLSMKPLTFLGKISYSVYLWHSAVIFLLHNMLESLAFAKCNCIIGFLLVSLFTTFVSFFSYNFLEIFALRKSKLLK